MREPRLPALDPKEAPQAAQPVLEGFLRARGTYPNMFRTLAVRPEIMRTAAEHMQSVTVEGTVPQRTKELCVLMVSALNDCEY